MRMLSDDFNAALEYSRMMRDTYLVHFYQEYSLDGRYVFIDKSACSTLLQKRLAIDTIYQTKKDPRQSLCIEEKIEQWPGYKRVNFALEIDSCTKPGRESQGWMHYAEADYLLYAFAYEGDTGLDAWLIDFPKLRQWFWSLPVRYQTRTLDTINRTRIELTPIEDVRQAVPTWNFDITSEGCHIKPRQANLHVSPIPGRKPSLSADRFKRAWKHLLEINGIPDDDSDLFALERGMEEAESILSKNWYEDSLDKYDRSHIIMANDDPELPL